MMMQAFFRPLAFAVAAMVLGATPAVRAAVITPELAAAMLQESAKPSPEAIISKREEEVLQLIAEGCSTVEVAERLYISVKTVKNHLASAYQKLDARDRTQAILRAHRMGIIKLD